MDDPKKLIKFDKDGNPVDGNSAKRIGDGFTQPEGYFDDFVKRMEQQLPRREEVENPLPMYKPTLWTRIRPYTYMAAMFCGIWLMLQVFGIITNHDNSVSLDIDPESALGKAVADERFVNEYIIDDVNSWDIVDSLASDSTAYFQISDSLYNAAITDMDMETYYEFMDSYIPFDDEDANQDDQTTDAN